MGEMLAERKETYAVGGSLLKDSRLGGGGGDASRAHFRGQKQIQEENRQCER